MTINIDDNTFGGPYNSPESLTPNSGVYAIICTKDGKNTLIDVGESGGIKGRVEDHDRTDCWKKHCDGTIRYADFPTPGKDQDYRRAKEKKIRDRYDPDCGKI